MHPDVGQPRIHGTPEVHRVGRGKNPLFSRAGMGIATISYLVSLLYLGLVDPPEGLEGLYRALRPMLVLTGCFTLIALIAGIILWLGRRPKP
jgi:hypothetical protein